MSKSNQSKSKPPPTPEEILGWLISNNIFAPDKVPLKKEIITDIKDLLGKEIQKQIKDLSNPCVLLVGSDDKTKLAACYAHATMSKCTSDLTQFKYKNCLGEDLITLKEDVEKWLDWFRSGHTVFLSRLKNEDIKACKQFARDIDNIKIEKPTSELGLLIIGVDSKCDLPEYLRQHFEPPVQLEPGKAEKVITRPTTAPEQLISLANAVSDPRRGTETIKTVVVPVEPEVRSEGKKQEKKAKLEKVRRKLSKPSEYLRLDDNDDLFYAKVKKEEKEDQIIFSTKTQEYRVLKHLYNIYDTEHNKATVEDLLIAGEINNHEKGEEITKEKTNHLGRVISDIRSEFERVGWKRGRLADEGDDALEKLYYLLIPIKE